MATDKKTYDAIKEKAQADKATNAAPPATLPTIELQNWYDTNRTN
jgi:hypothetical protein